LVNKEVKLKLSIKYIYLACVCYSCTSTISVLQNQVTAEAYFLSFHKSQRNRTKMCI